jgi:hypothetical protein
MRMPTHIVIDTRDGWTWARDRDGHPFTETTATTFRDAMNEVANPAKRTYVMAAVVPVMSPELTAALAQDATQGRLAIEPPADRFRCHGCGGVMTGHMLADAHKLLHGLVTNIGPGE